MTEEFVWAVVVDLAITIGVIVALLICADVANTQRNNKRKP